MSPSDGSVSQDIDLTASFFAAFTNAPITDDLQYLIQNADAPGQPYVTQNNSFGNLDRS